MSLTKIPVPSKEDILEYVKRKGLIPANKTRLSEWQIGAYIEGDVAFADQAPFGIGGGAGVRELGENNLKRLQQIVGLDMFRKSHPDAFLKQIHAKQIGRVTKKGNRLFESLEFGNRYDHRYIANIVPQHWVRYVCPSTGQVYVSGVAYQDGQSPDDAMAWKFRITTQEYLGILKET